MSPLLHGYTGSDNKARTVLRRYDRSVFLPKTPDRQSTPAHPRRGVAAWAFVLAITAAIVAALGAGSGCVHNEGTALASKTPDRIQRRLWLLEGEVASFVATPLDVDDEGRSHSAAESFAMIEKQTARLEKLRMRYFELVKDATSDKQRVLSMVRMAELHFDLGARIRRVTYPAGATVDERADFDRGLSRKALPLEAVGGGLIAQTIDLAQRRHLGGRFVDRARLYESLHAHRTLEKTQVATLEREWLARGPFRAPRRLLEVGRVGQRAARR